MGNNTNSKHGIITAMQEQLERVVSEMENLSEVDLAYYQAIRNLIDFKLNEEEVKRQFHEFNEMMISMGKLNFSKRVKIENSKDLFSYLGCTLNLLNEELEEKAVSKTLYEQVMEKIMMHKPDMSVLASMDGKIKYVGKNPTSTLDFEKEDLMNDRIQNFMATRVQFNVFINGVPKEQEVTIINKNSTSVPVVLIVEDLYEEHLDPHFLYLLKEKKAEN